MTDSNPSRADRWGFLVNAAFRLDEDVRTRGAALKEVTNLLDGALEVFTSDIDPLDDFEGYAVRRLLLSMHEALEKASDAHVSGERLPRPSHPRR